MIRTTLSRRTDPTARVPIDGINVMRQVGMVYWFTWGPHEFDIRVVRRLLGLPETRLDDNPAVGSWFKDDMTLDEAVAAYARAAQPQLQAIVDELRAALAGRSFLDVLANHDAEVLKRAQAL